MGMFWGVQGKSYPKGSVATWTGLQTEAAICFLAGGLVCTGVCRPGVTGRMTPMENEKSCYSSTFYIAD